jgi:hypothetical protein
MVSFLIAKEVGYDEPARPAATLIDGKHRQPAVDEG